MKIIIIGATGIISKHVVKALEEKNEILKVGSKSGDKQVDITILILLSNFLKNLVRLMR